MAAKSSSQRKAAERAAKRLAGLVPVEIWTRPEHKGRVLQYAERLNRRNNKLKESRQWA